MNIREALLKEHSKINSLKIAGYIENDEAKFAELVDLFLHDEALIRQRAGWVLSICCDHYHWLLIPHLKALLENLEKDDLHDAIKRNTVRVLQETDIPEELSGLAYDVCFRLAASAREAVAVKCFALTTLYNIVKNEPDLHLELRELIEIQMPYASAGFRSRGGKILEKLNDCRKM